MSSLAFMLIEKDLNLELSLQVIYYRKTAIEKTLKGIISKAERQATHANTKKKMEKSNPLKTNSGVPGWLSRLGVCLQLAS